MSRAFRLGLFIVATLTVLGIGVFLIGDKQFLFSSTYQLKASFPNVAGLNGGAPVRVGGIHTGTVKSIQLPTKPDGGMTVVMDMESSTRNVIKKDSVAVIQTEGLLGSKFVEVTFGSENADAISNGGAIQGVPPLDISDLIKKTNEILESASEISSKINKGEGAMGALLNDKEIYERLNDATAQAGLGAAAFQENMQALKTNFFLRGFFNRRGYDDSTRLTEHAVSELPRAQYLNRFVYNAKNLFTKPDSAKLKSEKTLTDVGRFLEGNPFGAAVVVARYGMKGDSDEARVLTEARAMVVRDFLVKNFKMNDTRVKTLGAGKSDQKDAGDDGTVEVVVYPLNVTIGKSVAMR